MSLDLYLFNLIHNLSGHSKLVDFLGLFFASYLPWILILLFILILFLEKDWKHRYRHFFIVVLASLLARGFFVEVIRFFYHRPRPYIDLVFKPLINIDFSYSFPSGHASLFFALAAVIFFFNRRWSYYFFLGATLISLGRIFVGVHWPTDILGGMVIGIFSALISKKIIFLSQKSKTTQTLST